MTITIPTFQGVKPTKPPRGPVTPKSEVRKAIEDVLNTLKADPQLAARLDDGFAFDIPGGKSAKNAASNAARDIGFKLAFEPSPVNAELTRVFVRAVTLTRVQKAEAKKAEAQAAAQAAAAQAVAA